MTFGITGARFSIAALLTVCLSAGVRAEVVDRVMAVVAGDLVLMSDVQAARELGLVDVPPPAADVNREVLSRLIDRALILAEVERFAPPEPDQAAVDKELAAVQARFPSPQAFADVLAHVGMEERHLRERLRQDLRMAAYINQRFTSVPPTEEELGRYYREHTAEFTRDGVLVPFETVRGEVAAAVAARSRRTVVEEWLTGLRRRADIRMVAE
jgi:hypothetical protein